MMLQRTNRLTHRWQSNQPAIGVTLPFPLPELAELCGLMGFDFVLIDREHGTISPTDCTSLVRACQLAGATPLARVSHNDPTEIMQALDAGAAGVMVPGIETVEEARRAVRSALYAPEGERGLASTRAAGWGLSASPVEYVRQANAAVIVVLLVESLRGIQNLNEIARIDGVDAVFLGPSDLSQSMGFAGEVSRPEVVRELETAIGMITACGKVAGINAPSGSKAREWVDQHGVRMVSTGFPQLVTSGGRQFLTEARPGVGTIPEHA